MVKKKKYKKGINKKYVLFILAIVIVFIGLLILYNEMTPESDVSYQSDETGFYQWGIQVPPVSEEKFVAPLPGKEQIIDNNYLSATFSDSFSSLAWLDTDETTLYFDWTGMNLLFPPFIDTQEIKSDVVLNTFVPEKAASGQDNIVLVGHNLLNNQKQILLWDLKQHTWEKFGFDHIGLNEQQHIIEIKSLQQHDSAKWLVFSKADESIKVSIIAQNLQQIDSKVLDVGFAQDMQISCGNEICLIYNSENKQFWNLKINDLRTQPIRELSTAIARKDPGQIVLARLNLLKKIWIIGLAKEQEFEIWQYSPELVSQNPISVIFSQTTQYPGHIALLPRSNGRVFVLWASYFTKAYEAEIGDQGIIFDLSSRFGWRISNDNIVQIYEFPNSVYINNNDGSLVRFSGEINTRIDHAFWFNFIPNFVKIIPNTDEDKDEGYLIAGVPGDGTKIYEFVDQGFDLSAKKQVVSQKVNFSVSNIGAAQISGLESGLGQAKIQYYLSNDGGENWHEAELGQIVKFENQGNDLRWKIKIAPFKKAIPYQTPYLRSINFTYWYQK